MAAGLQDGVVLVFGTGAETAYGLVQSQSINNEVGTKESKGPGGKITAIQQHGEKNLLSLSFLPFGGDSEWIQGVDAPVIGTRFEYPALSGTYWIVDSVSAGKKVDGFSSVDIAATNYPDTA